MKPFHESRKKFLFTFFVPATNWTQINAVPINSAWHSELYKMELGFIKDELK